MYIYGRIRLEFLSIISLDKLSTERKDPKTNITLSLSLSLHRQLLIDNGRNA